MYRPKIVPPYKPSLPNADTTSPNPTAAQSNLAYKGVKSIHCRDQCWRLEMVWIIYISMTQNVFVDPIIQTSDQFIRSYYLPKRIGIIDLTQNQHAVNTAQLIHVHHQAGQKYSHAISTQPHSNKLLFITFSYLSLSLTSQHEISM